MITAAVTFIIGGIVGALLYGNNSITIVTKPEQKCSQGHTDDGL